MIWNGMDSLGPAAAGRGTGQGRDREAGRGLPVFLGGWWDGCGLV